MDTIAELGEVARERQAENGTLHLENEQLCDQLGDAAKNHWQFEKELKASMAGVEGDAVAEEGDDSDYISTLEGARTPRSTDTREGYRGPAV